MGGQHARRGELLTVRAAEKAVGPEPPAADDATAKVEADVEPEESSEDEFDDESTLGKLRTDLKSLRHGGDPLDVAENSLFFADRLENEINTAVADHKKADEQLRLLKDQYRRLQADFDNFRSRADQEKAKSGSAAKSRVLEQLLPVIDNFEIAGKSIKTETEAEEKINESYQSLYRQTVDIFRNLGLDAVPTVGTPFDPEVHDGVMREENDDVPDGQVLEEFRKGFKYKDELLRPAMVKVAVSSSPPAEAEGEEESEKKE